MGGHTRWSLITVAKQLTYQQALIHNRLQTDLPYFCQKSLVIKLKEGGTAPFVFNKAQQYLHQRVEDQFQRTGMVRLFIIKGRQQGISTYIAARLYHKITRMRGKNVFILSHHATTTETLFQIVDRYHQSCPKESTPKCIVNNNRRMKFENGSQYTVGTAGSGSVGRGDTNQYFHGSEVAFYDNTDDINTGVVQTVADVPGTEKFMESTANGIGNYFHGGCMDALAGKGLYELVFIPWFWQEEYRTRISPQEQPNWQPTEEEYTLQDLYGLDDEQIQWRRNKLSELKSLRLFKQEYPCTVEEAFQSSGQAFINPELVAKARKSQLTDPSAPLILGVDPARQGDRTVISWRRGRHWMKADVYHEMDEMVLAGKLANIIDRYGVAKCFIDVALGYGTIDRLKERGYGHIVEGVHFSQKPNEDIYLNKRAEMAFNLRDWIHEGGVRIPDSEEIGVDLASIPDFKETSRGLLQLESKDTIKKKFGKSPDIFDSIILTFAQPVKSDWQTSRTQNRVRNTNGGSVLSARRHQLKAQRNDQTSWDDDEPTDRITRVSSSLTTRRK